MSQAAKDGPSIYRFTLDELIQKIREHEARKAERKKAEMLTRGSAQIIDFAAARDIRRQGRDGHR